MVQSYIILHAQKPKRDAYIRNLLDKYGVAAVDQIVPEGTIGIAEVRLLLKEMSRKPFVSLFKATVVEIENVSMEAQQAMLKTLEEPAAANLFFLSAPHVHLLLPTIVSRCTVVDLPVTENELPPQDLEKLTSFWRQFLTLKLGERFLLLGTIVNTKDEALNWLTIQICFLAQELRNSYTMTGSPLQTGIQLATLLTLLLEARERLMRNGALKLALDQVCIYVPFIS
ncbi:TPA: hypothetical protein DIV55_03170 [Patescibacteria group bacterium]|uniref:Polymerase III, delta' subunit domain protein n=1 Tax=Candidatus Gottesmanbacteria bacterium GW2011_GWA1_43_11 TaxID=1618436 RepID=A0A0G1FEN4_9BACT|nr:MAG: polymerase III, delta' subunit domain protein [Candidatus Gottesmanbacteria bacterium GW2011_GWA1_43_11]HCS78721.1 hypothetical protein [Patescibacteria group bacterium]